VIASGVDPVRDLDGLASLGVRYAQMGPGSVWSSAGLLARVGAPAPPRAEVAVASVDDPADDLDAAFRAVAHEVRTPLTVAMGYASMLEQSSDPAAARAALSIRRAADRINRMLLALEDVRMLDQDELQLEVRDLDLRQLVAGVVAEQRDLVGLPVEMTEDDEDGGPQLVTVDEVRIAQVLANLISNAAKFSPAGTPIEVRIGPAGEGRPGWVEVSVVDEGPGIAAAHLLHVFQKYGRGDRTKPGSGLGLYLARGVARAHGGEITYRHRRSGSGSVFSLLLPSALTRPSTDR
jgi:signal transduction histidine kinase